MPHRYSPVRWDRINRARDFLEKLELTDATSYVKYFHLYKNRIRIDDGLSMKENALILHPDMSYTNKKTGEIEPTYQGCQQTKTELCEFRKRMKNNAVIIYCNYDKDTGAAIYYNLPTQDVYHVALEHVNKIIKGMSRNKNNALSLFKLSKKERDSIAKFHGDELRRELLKKMAEKLSKKRKKEMEILIENEGKQTTTVQEEKEAEE